MQKLFFAPPERTARAPEVWFAPWGDSRSPAELRDEMGGSKPVVLLCGQDCPAELSAAAASLIRPEAFADVPAALRGALEAAGLAGALLVTGPADRVAALRAEFQPVYRKWLRRQKIRARDSLTPEQRAERSARTVERLAESRVFREARTVMIYDHVGGELSLDLLVTHPAAGGKVFCYPLCLSRTEMIAMVPGAWQPGAYGIREPVRARSREVAPEEIDLVICPGTAFDPACNRMGMGGGYYDRYLPRCTGAHVVMAAFEAQKVPAVPTDPWDRPVEQVFTELAVYHRPEAEQNPADALQP